MSSSPSLPVETRGGSLSVMRSPLRVSAIITTPCAAPGPAEVGRLRSGNGQHRAERVHAEFGSAREPPGFVTQGQAARTPDAARKASQGQGARLRSVDPAERGRTNVALPQSHCEWGAGVAPSKQTAPR